MVLLTQGADSILLKSDSKQTNMEIMPFLYEVVKDFSHEFFCSFHALCSPHSVSKYSLCDTGLIFLTGFDITSNS